MKLTSLTDPHITWATIGDYHTRTVRREGVHLVTTFVQEAQPYAATFSWLSFYLWCFVRSEAFTSRAWRENWDAAGLGGKYQTSREGIREAAIEFSKFDDTAQLQQEEAILAEFEELKKFSRDSNPTAREPITSPPPLPKPAEPPPPVVVTPLPEPSAPATPAAPSKPLPWRKWAKIAAAVLGVATIGAKLFAPGVVVLVLEGLKKILESIGG